MIEFFSNSFAILVVLVVGFFGFRIGRRISPGFASGLMAMDPEGFRSFGCFCRPIIFLVVLFLPLAVSIGSMVGTLMVVEHFLPVTLSGKIERFYKKSHSAPTKELKQSDFQK